MNRPPLVLYGAFRRNDFGCPGDRVMNLLLRVVPAENSQSAERVPAARLADGFGERKREGFGVGIVEEPAPVGLALGLDEVEGFGEARVGRRFRFGAEAGGAEIVESAKNVVVVARGKSEFEEFGVGDFAGGAPAEEGAGEEIFFGSTAGGGDLLYVDL